MLVDLLLDLGGDRFNIFGGQKFADLGLKECNEFCLINVLCRLCSVGSQICTMVNSCANIAVD
jgi:hypothetical protein